MHHPSDICRRCGELNVTGLDGRNIATSSVGYFVGRKYNGLPLVREIENPFRIDEGRNALGCECDPLERIPCFIE
tara:strand:+ start:1741 stop:1965 length:225 start_codon:yes stop_codon:yes gene_type:complete